MSLLENLCVLLVLIGMIWFPLSIFYTRLLEVIRTLNFRLTHLNQENKSQFISMITLDKHENLPYLIFKSDLSAWTGG